MNTNEDFILCRSVIDSLKALSLDGSNKIEANVYGLITRVTHLKTTSFFIITDGTAKIQLVIDHNVFNKDELAKLKSFKEYDLVFASGRVDKTNQGRPSIYINKVLEKGNSITAIKKSNISQYGYQVFSARVKKKISHLLSKENFTEINSSFVSSSWNNIGLPSLNITYPGFGEPVYLTPTPFTQILKFIAHTGNPKVFSNSKCFSTQYRSDFDGTESDIVLSIMLNNDLEKAIKLSKKIMKLLFNDLGNLPNRQFDINKILEKRVLEIPPENSKDLLNVTVFRGQEKKSDNYLFGQQKIKLFSFCIPFKIYDGRSRKIETNGKFTIACDGAEVIFGEDDLSYSTVTFHINRITKLLQDFIFPDEIPLFRTLNNLNIE